MIYVANPYMHEEFEVMEDRFRAAEAYTVRLMKQGEIVYSPIVHSHQMAINHDLPKGYKFWKKQCQAMVYKADKLHVLMLDGWKESTGVSDEIKLARSLKIEINYIPVTGE